MRVTMMDWDTTLSVEGVATAAGVLGAAIGYIVNLMKTWRDNGEAKKRRGTYATILHFLEDDLLEGQTEDQLWQKYVSPDSLGIRKRYRAISARKLDRVKFEALIRDLRLDRLIELIGRDQYRLESRFLDKYDLSRESRTIASQVAGRLISIDAITDRVRAIVMDRSLSRYERKDALELMIRVSPTVGVRQAAELMGSSDRVEVLIAGEVLGDLQRPSAR